jgi:hypothetical protein
MTLTLVWSEGVTRDEGFEIRLEGDTGVDLNYVSGNGTTTLIFTTTETVYADDTETFFAEAGAFEDAAGNGNATIASAEVTNNSTQTAGAAIRATSTGTLSSATTPTLPTHQAGDFLVVWIGSTMDDASGWTRVTYLDSFDEEIIVSRYTKVAASGSDTLVLAFARTAAYQGYSVSGYTGTDVSEDGDSSRGASTTISVPSMATQGANRILLTCFAQFSTATIGAPSAGTALDQVQAGNRTLRTAYEARPTQGATGTRTASSSASTPWVGAGILVY